jgi:hypothetical protein
MHTTIESLILHMERPHAALRITGKRSEAIQLRIRRHLERMRAETAKLGGKLNTARKNTSPASET